MNDNLYAFKDAVFYEISVRAFYDSNGDGHGDLPGLTSKLDYLKALGVDYLWLMPIYESPLRDDGYDISDYRRLQSVFGSVEEFRTLLDEAHRRAIRVITDLVLNHTSDEHAWFKESRKGRDSAYRDYYVWSDTNEKYKDARIIFTDTEPSNWSWDEGSGQYYWHRFYASQPDLNFDNPRVQDEMIDVARFWLEMGIDGFRADAVPYLFERDGTNCENLPETHQFLKRLRKFIDEKFPGRILLCEANQWPEDVRPYFGDGDEFQMGFHFPIMPRIYMALKKGSSEDMRAILARTPDIPESCQWCAFLRNHDELTLEMVTPEEREWMWQQYAPEPVMRLNMGIRRRLAPLLDNDRRKIELANSLLFTLIGSPIIYYGDEIGMGDNLTLPDRNGVRTPMQWTAGPNGGFSTGKPFAPMPEGQYAPQSVNVEAQMADPNSLFHAIRRMVGTRKAHKAFGWGDLSWVEVGTGAIAAYARGYQGQELLILNNLADETQTAHIPADRRGAYTELLTGEAVTIGETVAMGAYAYRWLERQK